MTDSTESAASLQPGDPVFKTKYAININML
jgi:hypothetical protein